MYITFKSPQVIGAGLVSLVATLGLEAINHQHIIPRERDDMLTLARLDSDAPERLESLNPESSEASWVSMGTNPQSSELNPSGEGERKSWGYSSWVSSQGATVRELEYCLMSMAQLSTDQSPLYVRSHPDKKGEIRGELESGRWISIIGATNDWFQIIDPTKGWVERSQVASGCNEKVERLHLSPRQQKVAIAEAMVGVSVHQYTIHVPPGKTLNLKQVAGTLPRVLDPDGKLLTEFWETPDDGYATWIGETLTSGDYTLEVVSHEERLEYSFTVEITTARNYAQILNR